ncbi:MAG TPA: hypothetical protein VFM10_02620 [Terriglobales bacterium]|nr:hypothetical protein [Terriglobales bacterium]
MTLYAKCPEGIDNPRLTVGKEYLVSCEDGSDAFYANDDGGDRMFCLWEDCAQLSLLGGLNWERVEKDDEQ